MDSLNLRDILLKLSACADLTRDEAAFAFNLIMSGQASEAQVGGLLVGLAAKGATVDELAAAASVMREKAVPIPVDLSTPVLDTCGTGGDVKGTFNISTAAAIIVAAAGVRVVKHGNRSASGKSGSADVLEMLGLRLDLTVPQLQNCVEKAGICFAFARNHHPAMKHVAPARTSLGIPTIFNLLGPLTNPGRARHQLLGVFRPELTARLAGVLHQLGSTRAWVVHALDGLDELSTIGPTQISELREGHVRTWQLDPATLGLPTARREDLRVNSVEEAADALRRVLAGERSPMRDIALLNAAAGLVIAEHSLSLPAGLAAAASAVDSGAARATLARLIEASRMAA